MSTLGLLFQRTSTIKLQLSVVVWYKADISPFQKIPPKLLLFNTTFITILVILLAIMCIHEGN
jgi:hypothetical protein